MTKGFVTLLALLGALLAPAAASADPDAPAQRGPAAETAHPRTFAVPAGEVRLARTQLSAGTPQPIRFSVALDRAPANAKLEVQLPPPFGNRSVTGLPFTGTPRLVANPRGRVRLSQPSRRALLVNLDGAPGGSTATFEIPDVGLPAGTYDLPLTWVAPDGTATSAGVAHVAIHAGEREGGGGPKGLAPIRAVEPSDAVAEDSSSDTDEESEDFIAVDPADKNLVATAANDITNFASGDGRKGVWLSTDGGQSFTGLLFSATLVQPDTNGTSTPAESAALGGDPILAADDEGTIWAGGLTRCNGPGNPSRIFVERIDKTTHTFGATGVGLPLLHNRCSSGMTQDKPMMTVNTFSGSPTYGRLAVTWDDPDPSGAVNVVISFCDTRPNGPSNPAVPEHCDAANNWSGPTVVSGPPGSYITSDPAFAPDGSISVVWWDYSATNAVDVSTCLTACTDTANWSGDTSTTRQVLVALSTGPGDAPVPFACPTFAQPGGRAAPVPSLTFDASGRPYLAWTDLRPDSGTTRCSASTPPAATQQTFDSYVATGPTLGDLMTGTAADRTSANQGTRIITDPGTGPAGTDAHNSDDWFPWIALDQSDGKAYVDVWSTLGDPTRDTANFYLSSVDPPASGTQPTISAPQKVSPMPSDYSTSPCCTFTSNDYGDYTGNAAAGGWAFPVWDQHPSCVGAGDVMTMRSASTPSGAPTDTTAPSLCGRAQDTGVLRANVGSWTNDPTDYTYQWQQCVSGTCSDITGATGNTYIVQTNDVGNKLRVLVHATNSVGDSNYATDLPSAQSPTAVPLPPANSVAPAVAGTAQEGSILTTDNGTWSSFSAPQFTYAWLRCTPPASFCAAIPGATAASYTLGSGDVGSQIESQVTAANAGGATPAHSSRTGVVETAPPPPPTTTTSTTPLPPIASLSLRVSHTQSRARLIRSGLAFRAACAAHTRCRVRAVLLLRPPPHSRAPTFTLASLSRTLRRTTTLRLRLGGTARNRLLHAGRRPLLLQVTATQSGHSARTRTITFHLTR